MSSLRTKLVAYLLAPFVLCATLTACEATKAAPAEDDGDPKVEAIDPNRLWCAEHSVYEDECVLCHPELAEKRQAAGEERDPNRLWCAEHGVYEDECVLCHPELAAKNATSEQRDPNRLWCTEHGVYEDECVVCHPEIADKKPGTAHSDEPESPGSHLVCKEHQLLEVECGICHLDRVGAVPVGQGLKIRFVSASGPLKAGVASAVPDTGAAGSNELFGQVVFNQNQFAIVSPLSGGIVMEVEKDVGDVVEAGELLATIQSAELAEAHSAYQKAVAEAELARKALKREQDLHQRQISARQDLDQAQAAVAVAQSAVAEAQQRMKSLGVTGTKGETVEGAMLSVRAPISGTIVERKVVQGTAVTPGDSLFQVANLSNMWMELSIPENLLTAVQSGGPIAARFDAYPGLAFEGEIRWVSPSIDSDTRMLQVRAELPNPHGLLKNGLFGRATLQGHANDSVVSVPASAVQDVDGSTFVFRKLADDLYEARRVEVGTRDGVRATVLAGLSADEEIVTSGSYIVKSELLKARLGAGCTDE